MVTRSCAHAKGKYLVWLITPLTSAFFPYTPLLGADKMTAIAVSFDSAQKRFVIAADGRVATRTLPVQVLTDSQQKIFSLQNRTTTLAYMMTGLARSGSFDIPTELSEQIRALAARSFADGYAFVHKLGFNMTRIMEKAVKDGRLSDIPDCDELPPEEKGRMLRIFPVGFYAGVPFWAIVSLYHDRENHRFSLRYQDFELTQFRTVPLGSTKIEAMVYGDAQVDPRMLPYRQAADNAANALVRTETFIKACSDPLSAEIDPWCRMIGGRLHAAELTKDGFAWLIPPAEW
jgi:hypothetical protein